jgi:hypothetical protein
MEVGAMIYISFINILSGIQKLIGEGDKQTTERRSHKPTAGK